ncbi:MAG: Trk system potassium transporter TrkA [Spirochaetaceae bacterium]|nr:Trk system potassium transporter TrkA [Spirochaetaceae bacterium]
MNAIIVGVGATGEVVAKSLIAKGYNVTLIEQDEEIARHVASHLDCMVINDLGNKIQVLQQAGISKADALIVVTESDELNLITCGIAENLAPDLLKIARVRNKDYLDSFEISSGDFLGIDKMVFPDEVVANAIIRAIEHGAISDIMDFESSKYEIARFTIHEESIFNGIQISQIREHVDFPFVVVAVETDGITHIPSGQSKLKSNSKISILALPEHIKTFYTLAGFHIRNIKKIAIIGMGRIGMMIADHFFHKQDTGFFKRFFRMQQNKNIIMVEKDETIAKECAKKYPDALVYNTDIMNDGFIEEARINECDLVIAVTQNYELNMISSTLLKNIGVSKTIALVQSPSMEIIANKIGIDIVISYKGAVADAILSHLSGKNVKSIHTVGDGTLEIIEISVTQTSSIIGKPIQDFSEHGVFLCLMFERNGNSVLPNGATEFEIGDRVLIICKTSESQRISKMIGGEK